MHSQKYNFWDNVSLLGCRDIEGMGQAIFFKYYGKYHFLMVGKDISAIWGLYDKQEPNLPKDSGPIIWENMDKTILDAISDGVFDENEAVEAWGLYLAWISEGEANKQEERDVEILNFPAWLENHKIERQEKIFAKKWEDIENLHLSDSEKKFIKCSLELYNLTETLAKQEHMLNIENPLVKFFDDRAKNERVLKEMICSTEICIKQTIEEMKNMQIKIDNDNNIVVEHRNNQLHTPNKEKKEKKKDRPH